VCRRKAQNDPAQLPLASSSSNNNIRRHRSHGGVCHRSVALPSASKGTQKVHVHHHTRQRARRGFFPGRRREPNKHIFEETLTEKETVSGSSLAKATTTTTTATGHSKHGSAAATSSSTPPSSSSSSSSLFVIDVDVNTGFFTLLSAAHGATVYGFELQRTCISRVREHLANNPLLSRSVHHSPCCLLASSFPPSPLPDHHGATIQLLDALSYQPRVLTAYSYMPMPAQAPSSCATAATSCESIAGTRGLGNVLHQLTNGLYAAEKTRSRLAVPLAPHRVGLLGT